MDTFYSLKSVYQAFNLGEPASQYFSCHTYQSLGDTSNLTVATYRLMFHHVSLITNGNSEVVINNKTYTMSAGTLFMSGAGNVQTLSYISNLQGYSLLFDPAFLSINVQKSDLIVNLPLFSTGSEFVINLPPSQVQMFSQLFENILEEQAASEVNAEKHDLIRSYLLILLLKAKPLLLSEKETAFPLNQKNKLIVYQFQNQITNHLHELATGQASQIKLISDFAADLNITPNYLNEVVKIVLGRSASRLLQERLTTEALFLLRQKDLSISEVAYRLGFTSNAYFSNFFKKMTTYTPSQYKDLLNR